MQVGIRNEDGRLLLGRLEPLGRSESGEQIWMFRDHLELNHIMGLIQSLPEELEVSRVKYSNMPLHWNILGPNMCNKKGVSTIATVSPDPHFALWTVIVREPLLAYQCFIPTTRSVVGLPGIKTYEVQARSNIVFDREGVPYRENAVNLLTEKIFSYVLRYHSDKLNAEQQQQLEVTLPKKSLIRRLMRIEGADFLKFIHSLPGRKLAVISTKPTPETPGYIIDGVGELQLFAWVPPWALNGMCRCTHLQVDASFKGARPYAYYIPQAIIANRGLACGLVVAPTEKDELFASYHRLLRFHELGIDHPPVLADLGGAIHSFAEQEGLQLYMCHRHLLEAIGSSSCAISLFQPLLRALTEDEFLAAVPQFVNDIAAFANYGLIDHSLIEKFEKYLGCVFKKDGSRYTGEITDLSQTAIEQWALFARQGVATCSNQAEALHKHVNRRTRENTSFMTKLLVLIEAVKNNFSTINDRIIHGVQKKQKSLEKKLRQRIELENVRIEAREHCNCPQHKRNELLYQCEGFCYHTIAAGKLVKHHPACLMNRNNELETEDPIIVETTNTWKFAQRHKRKKVLVKHKPSFGPSDCGTVLWSFVHSCSLLLDLSMSVTLDIVFIFFADKNIDANKFNTATSSEIAEYKAQLVQAMNPAK